MTAGARAAAHDLMRASLSAVGYAKAVDVIRLEGVLRQLETFGGFTREPDNYLVTVFGTPAPAAPWGWRLEGHHLSLNFTVVPGRAIAVTPAFLGANPTACPRARSRGSACSRPSRTSAWRSPAASIQPSAPARSSPPTRRATS